LQTQVLLTDALAGSTKRGENEETDFSLQEKLLNDKKNLAEHNAVINFLKEQLLPLSEEIISEDKPVIRKLSNIQHLYTPISARIKKGISVFSILEKIHPTPAVCGIPPQTSKNLISEIENFERGLYAGALGWVGLNDTAEMFVGIRSAVLNENHLRAFAGGGIVEGSNSADEYNETVLKLKPILSLFTNENIS
jgi:menaquinone-specific isochorismate synthase